MKVLVIEVDGARHTLSCPEPRPGELLGLAVQMCVQNDWQPWEVSVGEPSGLIERGEDVSTHELRQAVRRYKKRAQNPQGESW